jgi:hypothetical protein
MGLREVIYGDKNLLIIAQNIVHRVFFNDIRNSIPDLLINTPEKTLP